MSSPPGPRDQVRGLYVHVPFCARACPYCDFDFVVGRRPATDAFLDGLEREWSGRGVEGAFDTIYVGGGTPSSLGPEGLARLLAWLRGRASTNPREFTVELNPEHVGTELLAALVEGGATRVSLGVQTFDPRGLASLGRAHDPAQARQAVAGCLQAGLSTSVDLIVGWPGQSVLQLDADLDTVLGTGIGHVSIYALTVEPGTPWQRAVEAGRRPSPDPDAQGSVLGHVEHRLRAVGWQHYEVASYAREGERGQHNLGYWTWRDYVGIGPSAASATFGVGEVRRHTNLRGFGRWRDAPGAGEDEHLDGAAAAGEGLWTGLRVLHGIDVPAFQRRFPMATADWLERRVLREVARGNLEWVDERRILRVGEGRWLWHDAIAASVL